MSGVMMKFLEIIRNRRSVRRFSDKKVPPFLVKKIIEAGTFAPTNCNQQLWNFVVITDGAIKERLVRDAASSTIILRAPVVIAVLYDGWNYKEAIQGGSLALQNMLLASTYYGVGCLSMNSYGADTVIKKILKIPDNQTICCFMLLGYPDKIYKNTSAVPRREIVEVLHNNYFVERAGYQTFNSYNPENWSLKSLREFQKYYCRKTFLGKEMDILHSVEKSVVQNSIKILNGRVLDFFSYDGTYVDLFPANALVTTTDLCSETAEYTKTAVKGKNCFAKFENFNVYDESVDSFGIYDSSTLIYKAERLPRTVLKRVLLQSYNSLRGGGEILIISRRNNILFMIFYHLIKLLFGDDTRKTGIYAFFGPYKPLDSFLVRKYLMIAGFSKVKMTNYCFIPPFFEQAYQMFLQFRKSEGSTYLHRVPIVTPVTRFLSWIIRIQGLRKSIFGSIIVIRAVKK
ncbi:nitroreductase [Candidatus Woesearchaeota archaeon]|nr:nitroreductase [Candidatus Woesearchaeota archaeon]